MTTAKKHPGRVVIIFITIIVFVVVAYRYKAYMIDRNFMLSVNTVCDPTTEDCFVADTESADIAYGNEPYKKVMIRASDAPKCLEEHDCESFSCPVEAANCTITYCSDDTLDEGETCFSQE